MKEDQKQKKEGQVAHDITKRVGSKSQYQQLIYTRNSLTILETNSGYQRGQWGRGRHTLWGEDERIHRDIHTDQKRQDSPRAQGTLLNPVTTYMVKK